MTCPRRPEPTPQLYIIFLTDCDFLWFASVTGLVVVRVISKPHPSARCALSALPYQTRICREGRWLEDLLHRLFVIHLSPGLQMHLSTKLEVTAPVFLPAWTSTCVAMRDQPAQPYRSYRNKRWRTIPAKCGEPTTNATVSCLAALTVSTASFTVGRTTISPPPLIRCQLLTCL